MIAAPVNPADNFYFFTFVSGIELTAIVAAHCFSFDQEASEELLEDLVELEESEELPEALDDSEELEVLDALDESAEPDDLASDPDRFFLLPDLKSVSYQPPPFRRNPDAETFFTRADS